MLFAFCTLLAWTVAGFSSAQAARIAGSLRANLWRLLIASLPMLVFGPLFASEPLLLGVFWFALGGILHLGLGDIGLFGAYRRLGPRLGFLICGCSIPVMAGVIEWLWLGVVPSVTDIVWAITVLTGVIFALAPTEKIRVAEGAWWPGITAGLLGGLGQALGAVATRKGYEINPDAGAMEPAFWRVFGGAVILALIAFGLRIQGRTPGPLDAKQCKGVSKWLFFSVLFGPVVGIPCYQMALAAVPASIVHAILACLPLTVIPLAWWIDGDRPSWRALVGGAVAVAAAAGMMLNR